MALYHWSETAATNAGADPAINMAEGMAPSAVNDGYRAGMAVLKKWSNDISGVIVTSGTSTAFTVTSHSVFDTLAHMDGQIVAFSPHTTSTGTATLNVDGLGAKPLRSAPSTEILSGVLIQGTPYVAVYSNADGAFYLHGFYGQPLNVPLFAGMDYWHTVAPNSSFIFPAGQAVSRTTFAAAFTAWGTTYGAGDGSTTFNVPDKTERVSVMKASSATRLTSTYFGGDSTALGAVGGGESKTLLTANLPAYTPSGSIAGTFPVIGTNTAGPNVAAQFNSNAPGTGAISATFTGTAQGGTSTPIRTVQPTIVCNYIIRII